MVYRNLRLTHQTPDRMRLPLPQPLPMRNYAQQHPGEIHAQRPATPTAGRHGRLSPRSGNLDFDAAPDTGEEALAMLDEISFSFEKLRRELDAMDDDTDPRPAA